MLLLLILSFQQSLMIIFIHQNGTEHTKREKNTVITKIALTS